MLAPRVLTRIETPQSLAAVSCPGLSRRQTVAGENRRPDLNRMLSSIRRRTDKDSLAQELTGCQLRSVHGLDGLVRKGLSALMRGIALGLRLAARDV